MKAVTFAVVVLALWVAADAKPTDLLVETPTVIPATPILRTLPSIPGHNIRFCFRDGEVQPCAEDSTKGEIVVPAQPLPVEKIVLEPTYPYGHLYDYRYFNPLTHYAYAPAPYVVPGGHGIPLVNYALPEYAIGLPATVEAKLLL